MDCIAKARYGNTGIECSISLRAVEYPCERFPGQGKSSIVMPGAASPFWRTAMHRRFGTVPATCIDCGCRRRLPDAIP